MFPEYKARESVKKLIFWFFILYVFKYIDKYIEVRYNITIEVRYIALKGKVYGCTYKKGLRSHDGDKFLHIVMSSYSKSWIRDCTKGKRADR